MNLRWSSPRAGENVLVQGKNCFIMEQPVHSLLQLHTDVPSPLNCLPPAEFLFFFLLLSNSVPSQLSGTLLLVFFPLTLFCTLVQALPLLGKSLPGTELRVCAGCQQRQGYHRGWERQRQGLRGSTALISAFTALSSQWLLGQRH